MSQFAIATFAYSERYQKQVNRMISEIDSCDFKPTVVVVTDNVDNILDKPFVKKYDISQFNPEYKNYSNNYYTFDFSVKRYSLLAALNLGYTKIILSDADAVPNKPIFKEELLMNGFVKNSIQGQVTYNFTNQITTNSQLGERFLVYEKYFNVIYDKDQLNFMPEDCIQFLDIEMPKFYNFLRVWDECIQHKKKENLANTPAGNIDEMCFAALHCGLTVGNNSDKCMNNLTPIHDKWYDSAFNLPSNQEVKSSRKKTIVSSVYELNYIQNRGGAIYKGFNLLTETIRSIIFGEYNYVIYTDNYTFNKYNLKEIFNYPNVTVKIQELNGDFYTNFLEPIRLKKNEQGEIWDRIFCVKNYVEVMYNKLDFLVEVAEEIDTDVCWIDAGLFGTSCNNGWRDHLKNHIVHSKNFVDKIFQKIDEEDFIALKGEHILINYEVKDKIKFSFGERPFIVPGGLFGGKKENVLEYLTNYKDKVREIVSCLGEYTSDQELMCLLLQNKKCKFFEFNDWDDLQRGILKIMDLYDEETYQTHTFLPKNETGNIIFLYGVNELKNISEDMNQSNERNLDNFTQIADFFGIDKGSLHESHMYTKTYEEYMTPYLELEPTIVEIGINDTRFPGGGMKFWDKIFPRMNYYGFDIVNCEHLKFNTEKIQIFQGDQSKVDDLEKFVFYFNIEKKIDFIIDDGSHEHDHIVTSFETLFPYLKKGGVYFVEDLHAGQAKRSETIHKIKKYLDKYFDNRYVLDDRIYKLLIVKKV